jgi:hypothetical protein
VSSSAELILLIGILVAALLVIAGFLIPIFLGGAGRPRSRPGTRRFADSPANHLIIGVAYLLPPLDFSRSRGSVQRRMARAFSRIDSVDPYSAPRRISSALLDAGFVDTPTQLPAAEPQLEWEPGESEAVRSPDTDQPESIWSPDEMPPRSPATPETDVPPQSAGSGPIWAHAEPEAEFGAGTDETDDSRFDRHRHEQSRDEE